MKCIIPGLNVKIFGKAIHSLAKVGEELYIEPLNSGLSLRTVNSCRSAYACFMFNTSFFVSYDVGNVLENSLDDEDILKCKIHMKCCFNIFKSLSSLEKMVEKCKITVNYSNAKIIFRLYCKHGIVKTYNLAFIECETLQAIFAKDKCSNTICAQSRLLNDALVNFQTNQEEVTVTVTSETMNLKNYIDNEPDPTKVLYTEVCLCSDEFDNYEIFFRSEITFCLKELRALLLFADSINIPINIYFEASGNPVIFNLEETTFEVQFVLATLADSIPQDSQTATSSQTAQVKKSIHKQGIKGKRNAKIDGVIGSIRNQPTKKQKSVVHIDKISQPSTSKQSEDNAEKNIKNSSLHILSQDNLDLCLDQINNHGDIGECVPGTPPSKKFKSMFFGLSQRTCNSELQFTVLAEDTDEDD